MRRLPRIGLMIVLVLGVSLTARAADDPLLLIGQGSTVLIRMEAPAQLIETAASLSDEVQADSGDRIRKMKADLGKLISNPDLVGVDETRDWYVAAYMGRQSDPIVVFLLPATDEDAMIEALGSGITAHAYDGWVSYSEFEKFPAAGRKENSLQKLRDDPLKAFKEAQLGIYINAGELTSIYNEQLDLLNEQFLSVLNVMEVQLQAQATEIPIDAIMQFYRSMVTSGFQAVYDANEVCLGVYVSDQGLSLDAFAQFRPGTETAQGLADLPGSTFRDLGKLPDDAVGYFCMAGGMKEMVAWGGELSLQMSHSPEEVEELTHKLQEDLKEVHYGSICSALTTDQSLRSGLFQIVGITQGEPLEKIRELNREIASDAASGEFGGLRQTSTLKKDAEEIDGQSIDVLLVEQEYDNQPGMQEFQKLFYGSQGMEVRTAYTEQGILSVTGGGVELMEESLKNLQGEPQSQATELLSKLPEKQVLYIAVDLPGLIADVLSGVSALQAIPIPINQSTIESIGLVRSYYTLSVSTATDQLQVRTSVPKELMQGFAKLINLGAQMLGQQF